MLKLQTSSLDWVLKHALKFGDTDVFPIPFEYEAIRDNWGDMRDFLSNIDVTRWSTRPHRSLLSPKSKFGFRVITQLDPLDFLLYAAAVYEIGSDIEAARIPTSEKIVMSYRFSPDSEGRMFDPTFGYSDFRKQGRDIFQKENFSHVAIADIADFYSRIYVHRLRNPLNACTKKNSHVTSIMSLLSGWSGTESFGIPIGNAPSRMLAEITINDVDRMLLAKNIRYIRYNDDYRLYANSYGEGYRHLAFLASMLFDSHGLTLQPQKTIVLNKEDYLKKFVGIPEEKEITAVETKFEELIDDLGISDPYEDIEYDDLDDEQKELIDSLNLTDLFNEELQKKDEIDYFTIKFIIRRMGQLGDSSILDSVLGNLEILYPVFSDIIRYIGNLRYLTSQESKRIGGRILSLLENSIVSELDYHRMWALELFARSGKWNNDQQFFTLLEKLNDMHSRRKIILAMGRAGQNPWFQSRWRRLFEESHWPRRALLAAASCMPADARQHWYGSVEAKLDPLEKCVMRWARRNPFSGTS